MGPDHLIVTDLDGTVLGDASALERFRAWYTGSARAPRLVYASGRRVASIQALIDDRSLPRPDAMISSVGTAIHDGDGYAWPGWSARFEGWHADQVRAVLRGLRWLDPQPAENQTPLKASYQVRGLRTGDVGLIRRTLEQAGLAAAIVYSDGLNLDILPETAGKGRAARFVADAWGIPQDRVLAFGDSGNDLDLLSAGFLGTIVANAGPELVRQVAADVYRSPAAYADGVLDGIRHWTARRPGAAAGARPAMIRDRPPTA